MTIIGNSLFNAGATVDTSKDGSAASFQAAIGTTYEIDLSLNDSAGETVVTFPSSPTRGDAFAVVITGTQQQRVVSFTGTVSGVSVTAAYGMSRAGQYAIFRYFNATVGWLMHTNKHDVNNTIANGNTNLVLGSDNTCDALSTTGSMCVGHNNSATGYVDNIVIGAGNSLSNLNAIAVGRECSSTQSETILFGRNNTANGYKAIAIGKDITSSGSDTLSVGKNLTTTGQYGTNIGQSNTAGSGQFNVTVGLNNNTNTTSGFHCLVGFSNDASAVTGNNQVVMLGKNNTLSGDTGIPTLPTMLIGDSNTVSNGNSRAVLIGSSNEATGASTTNCTAIGAFNESTASNGNVETLLGALNTIQGTGLGGRHLCVGNENTVTTSSAGYSSAIGNYNQNSGGESYIAGNYVVNTVDGVMEFGCHTSLAGREGPMIRGDATGLVQFSIEDSATPPADGGATLGSEAEGNLARGAFTIHKNGSAVTLYYNNAGIIESLSLGTLV